MECLSLCPLPTEGMNRPRAGRNLAAIPKPSWDEVFLSRSDGNIFFAEDHHDCGKIIRPQKVSRACRTSTFCGVGLFVTNFPKKSGSKFASNTDISKIGNRVKALQHTIFPIALRKVLCASRDSRYRYQTQRLHRMFRKSTDAQLV